MTELLLDTHALLWVLTEPDRVPASTLARVRDPGVRIVASAASAWEVATKHRLGRLPGAAAIVQGYEDHLRTLGADELPVSARHALVAGGLTWDHGDPFDRLIAAQAMLESIPVVTADDALTAFPGIRVVW